MVKKLVLCFLVVLTLFSGCDYSSAIDNASIVQMISVEKSGGQIYYTFFLLDNSDKNSRVSIKANSLKDAYTLAQQKYIPNVSMLKFELFVINENLYKETLIKDICFMSTQYSVSPCVYVSLCTEGYLKFLYESNDAVEQTENSIILLKKNDVDTSVNCLSIFNSISSTDYGIICMPCINSKKEINKKYYNFSVTK